MYTQYFILWHKKVRNYYLHNSVWVWRRIGWSTACCETRFVDGFTPGVARKYPQKNWSSTTSISPVSSSWIFGTAFIFGIGFFFLLSFIWPLSFSFTFFHGLHAKKSIQLKNMRKQFQTNHKFHNTESQWPFLRQ